MNYVLKGGDLLVEYGNGEKQGFSAHQVFVEMSKRGLDAQIGSLLH
jgi:hypothetical protein